MFHSYVHVKARNITHNITHERGWGKKKYCPGKCVSENLSCRYCFGKGRCASVVTMKPHEWKCSSGFMILYSAIQWQATSSFREEMMAWFQGCCKYSLPPTRKKYCDQKSQKAVWSVVTPPPCSSPARPALLCSCPPWDISYRTASLS